MTRITPGTYVEETPSRVPTISGLATSVTAFIGQAPRGPAHEPILVQSFGEYTQRFGELSRTSPMSYAVFYFFQAGGTDALIVRVTPIQDAMRPQPATTSLNSEGDDDGPISGIDVASCATLEAAREGLWALEKAEHFNLMCIPPYSFDVLRTPRRSMSFSAS